MQAVSTVPNVLQSLQTAWGRPPDTPVSCETNTVVLVVSAAGCGVSIEACSHHIPPFDAILTRDPKRNAWDRLVCRLCGRLIGYRPVEHSFETIV